MILVCVNVVGQHVQRDSSRVLHRGCGVSRRRWRIGHRRDGDRQRVSLAGVRPPCSSPPSSLARRYVCDSWALGAGVNARRLRSLLAASRRRRDRVVVGDQKRHGLRGFACARVYRRRPARLREWPGVLADDGIPTRRERRRRLTGSTRSLSFAGRWRPYRHFPRFPSARSRTTTAFVRWRPASA